MTPHTQRSSTSDQNPLVLVTVSGQDAPGITSAMTEILAEAQATIVDMGQSVIHGLLSLSILFEVDTHSGNAVQDKTTIKDLLFKATELGLKLEFKVIDPSQDPSLHADGPGAYRYVVTLIAERLSARAVHAVTALLARYRLNIDRIKRLSERDLRCIEFLVSGDQTPQEAQLRSDLMAIAKQEGADIAFQSEGLFRRVKRLVVLDMDSTLIQAEVIDELARVKGVYEEVSSITQRAMRGEMDFDESLKRRVHLLAGMTEAEVHSIVSQIQLTPGAETLIQVLKRLGYKIALISGGFTFIADRFRIQLQLDYVYANELEWRHGKLSGQVRSPIINAIRKADLLEVIAQQERISSEQIIAIGDGANDIPMLQKAGLGIAFNAKPAVRERAGFALNQKSLRSILYLLGISGRDIDDLLHRKEKSSLMSSSSKFRPAP